MMIAPEGYIEFLCKDKKYEELLEMRDDLLSSVYDFEKGNIPQEAYMISPSPEVRYQMNLKYLGELCKLISDKYNLEYVWSKHENDAVQEEESNEEPQAETSNAAESSKEELFIDEVAEEVFSRLSEKSRQFIKKHPDPGRYQADLGLGIRTQYIYDKGLDFRCSKPDELSLKIIERIIKKVALCEEDMTESRSCIFEYRKEPSWGHFHVDTGAKSISVYDNGDVVKRVYLFGEEKPDNEIIEAAGPELAEAVNRILMRYSEEIDRLPEYLDNGSMDGPVTDIQLGSKRVSRNWIVSVDPDDIQQRNPDYYEQYKDNIVNENTVLDICGKVFREIEKFGIETQLNDIG